MILKRKEFNTKNKLRKSTSYFGYPKLEGKRINNSFIESRNRQIGSLIYNANGLSNFKRTRNKIMCCINKNDTYSI